MSEIENEPVDDDAVEKVMIVVGRSESIPKFKEAIDSCLYDNFTLKIIEPIEDEVGIDGNVRMIGFVVGVDMSQYTFESVALRLQAEFQFSSSETYEDLEEAFMFAHTEYGFGDEQIEHLEKLKKVSERFPPATAAEIEQYEILDALFQTHQIRAVRALFDDEPVFLLVKITESSDEFRVSPMAVLVGEVITPHLEYQWEEVDDEN